MKRFPYIAAAVLFAVFAVWIGSVVNAGYLTAKHADEFADYHSIGFDFMHPWEGDAELRVLSYGKERAAVYFYSAAGGEKAIFVREQGGWVYYKTVALWSVGGSAEDYFVWPYFKNFVI